MTLPLVPPITDPTPIFDLHRGHLATELMVGACVQFKVFDRLAQGGKDFTTLRGEIGLGERPAYVLFTALKAMGLLLEHHGRLTLSELAREHLVSGGPFSVDDYLGLTAENPGVVSLVERLRANKPKGFAQDGGGAAYIYKDGMDSAMEQEASARRLTLALSGRAKNVAPVLAARVRLDAVGTLLDVGGGTGIYGMACLQRNLRLKLIVWDRPEVLKIAHEMAVAYGVLDRTTLLAGDMFKDPVPAADAMLVSNVLHDWDLPECNTLLRRLSEALPRGGRMLIHDALLNDAHDGPLPVALFSTMLFILTEGRNYSTAEYRTMLRTAGLTPLAEVIPTLVHCGVIEGVKS
jgi:predicted O-methyltransferase YrrM